MRAGIDSSLDALRRISRCMTRNRVSSTSLALSDGLSLPYIYFLAPRFFFNPPPEILSRAFGIDRAAVDSFIVHRVVYLLRLLRASHRGSSYTSDDPRG